MKSLLPKLEQEARKISLSSREKHAMHAALMTRVHGAAAPAPVRSQPGLYYFFNPQFAMSFAAFMLLVLAGSATAFAAKGSLPGDALYTVKTKISEPLQGALAFSTEDKIRFQTEIAETRIVEAEVLASQNRLDTKATAELESGLDIALAQRNELAQKFEQERPEESGKLARLDTTIVAHGDILLQLGAESSSTTTRENSGTLAMKVRSNRSFGYNNSSATLAMAKAAPAPAAENAAPVSMALSVVEDVATTNQATSRSAVPTSSDNTQVSKKNSRDSKARAEAAALDKKATTTLISLRAKAASMKKMDEDTKERLEARFEKIESFIEEGNNALARGDYSDAKESFNEALDREATLSAFISAGVQFNKGILGNLLGNDSRWGSE